MARNTNPYTGQPYTAADLAQSAADNARAQAFTQATGANQRTIQTMNGPMTSGLYDPSNPYYNQNKAQWDAQYTNQLAAKNDPNSPANAQADAAAAKKEMFDLSQGGIDRLKGDSTDAMIRDYLQNQMSSQTLDPNTTPFANGAPQHTAALGTAAQMAAAPQIGGGGPWDSTSRAAYMTDASDRAAGGEAARNQMIRDAILQSGGNASDPSLAASMAESMSQRNNATAQAGNQLNMRATSDNFNAQRQADLANQAATMSQNQTNAGLQQQTGLANQGAQNQAGMFNTQNTMQAGLANFNAGNNARMFNQGQQTQATNQLAGYNNQRLNMLQNAEGNKINLLGQQRFSTPGQPAQMGGMPNFQQFQAQARPQAPQQNAGYQNPSITGGLTGSVWAGSGRPSVGSGTTTSSFGPTTTGPATQSPMVGNVGAPYSGQGTTYNPFPRPPPLAPQIMQQYNPANSDYSG